MKELPNTVCTHWLKGYCAFGDKCRYDHVRPEWAPRQDAPTQAGYIPPTVPKPEAADLDALPPISQLRLGGAVAHLPPGGPSGAASTVISKQIEFALHSEAARSPPPIDLPADPFGAGEEEQGVEPTDQHPPLPFVAQLPDDLDLGADSVLQPSISSTLQGQLSAELAALSVSQRILDPGPYEGAFEESSKWTNVGALSSFSGGPTGSNGILREGERIVNDFESVGNPHIPVAAGLYGSGSAGIIDEDTGEYGTADAYGNGTTAEYGSYPGGHSRSSIGFGSVGGRSSAGEFGGGEYMTGSTGTSPPLHAWHIPRSGAGPGSEGGWGAGAADASRFYASPGLASLCWEYYNTGRCMHGDNCQMAHGEWCETCSHYALHPTDPVARESHVVECTARHARLDALRRSAHVECNICYEPVTEKPVPSERRFGLLQNCDHAFCLSCIRNWRQQYAGGADVDAALRTCPICRTPTHLVTPSMVWPSTPEEKEKIIAGYKAKLAEIDCKHFSYGEGSCPFGTSCLYRHAYRNGRLEEAAPRRVAADEGEIHVVQPVRLSDFIVVQSGRVRGSRRR